VIDGRTDRIIIAIPRLQRGKKVTTSVTAPGDINLSDVTVFSHAQAFSNKDYESTYLLINVNRIE